MKKILALLLSLACVASAAAQSISISANTIDTDGTAWANGTWTIDFVPNPSQPGLGQYYYNNGGTYQQLTSTYNSFLHQTGSMDGSGNVLSAVALNNNLITPTGSQWKITLCPNASSKCGSLTFAVTSGPTWTISGASITAAIPAPRFNAVAGQYGYADVEALLTIPIGATYWNVSNECQRYNNGTSWACTGTGTGTVSGQASGVVPLASGPTAITTQSHLDDGVTTSATLTALEPLSTKFSPMADIRANGAVIDGATDIGPAIALSEAQCNVTNGNACTILLPCAGPNGCYWANGSDGVTIAQGVTLILQGTLHLQTSLITGNVTANIIGSDGGFDGVQFGAPNQIAQISVNSAANGVLGTAVTVTPTATGNFGVTQAFTPSVMTGLYAGTWMTIGGPLTCTISTITRTSNVVSATLSGACHIPPGVPVTVAGVTDSSFDGTYTGTTAFVANSSDYVQNTMGWLQTASNSSSTGGTVTGLNEDTSENVQLASCTTNTCTTTFYRSHASTDLWGVDGVALDAGPTGSHAQLLKNITIRAPGTLLDAGGFNSEIQYVSGSAIGQCSGAYYSFPVSVIGSSYLRFSSDTFDGVCDPWAMHVWNQYNYAFATAGGEYIKDSFFIRGIKLDHGGGDMFVSNSTCDQCYAAISYDPNWNWNGNVNEISLDRVEFNDNTVGFSPVGFYQLYPVGTNANSPLGVAHIEEKGLLGSIKASVNDYAPQNSNTQGGSTSGSLRTDISLPSSTITPRGVTGTYNDGKVIDGEVRGEGANFSAAIVPYPTDAVPAPGSWSGGCTVTTGVLAPDGTTNAAALTQNTGAFETFYSHTGLTPAVGDVVLFGGWVYSPTSGVAAIGSGSGFNIYVTSNGSTHFSFNNFATAPNPQAGANDSGIINDWYHAVAGIAIVTASDGTSGQTVKLTGSCDTVKTIDYFNPWMMYIPASANIPLAEIERWRTQLLHSYVPPSASTGVAYLNPALKLGFGTAVDLYASSSQLQTDEAFQADGVKSNAGGCAGATPYMKYDGTCGAGATSGPVAVIAPTTFSGTAGISPTTFYTTPNDGTTHQYMGCTVGTVTVAGTAGTGSLSMNITYSGHAMTGMQTGNLTLSTQWSTANLCGSFLADPNTAVQYRLFMSGATGTPTVGYGFTLTQLQ